jgi:hypothetical protein
MPLFRIFRMKDHARQSFRSAPHTSGETAVKLKDYIEAGSVEAANVYEAWESLRSSESPLEVGDILETELGQIRICKYVGFEAAKWILPEVKAPAEPIPAAGEVSTAGNI